MHNFYVTLKELKELSEFNARKDEDRVETGKKNNNNSHAVISIYI